MKEMVGGCCVCSDERGWTENPLVYCDGQGCNVAVHQACYGIITVPSGPWFCRKCESQERAARVRCEMCPQKDGALKRTDTGGWCHVVCALFIPEAWFGNVQTMEPIILKGVPPERFNKVSCYICEESNRQAKAMTGGCMQCNKSGCKAYFHVTCAQQLGLLCEEAGNYDNVKYCGYCSYHFKKLKKDRFIKAIPAFKPIQGDLIAHKGESPEKIYQFSDDAEVFDIKAQREKKKDSSLKQIPPFKPLPTADTTPESSPEKPGPSKLKEKRAPDAQSSPASTSGDITSSGKFTTANFREAPITHSPANLFMLDQDKKQRSLNARKQEQAEKAEKAGGASSGRSSPAVSTASSSNPSKKSTESAAPQLKRPGASEKEPIAKSKMAPVSSTPADKPATAASKKENTQATKKDIGASGTGKKGATSGPDNPPVLDKIEKLERPLKTDKEPSGGAVEKMQVDSGPATLEKKEETVKQEAPSQPGDMKAMGGDNKHDHQRKSSSSNPFAELASAPLFAMGTPASGGGGGKKGAAPGGGGGGGGAEKPANNPAATQGGASAAPQTFSTSYESFLNRNANPGANPSGAPGANSAGPGTASAKEEGSSPESANPKKRPKTQQDAGDKKPKAKKPRVEKPSAAKTKTVKDLLTGPQGSGSPPSSPQQGNTPPHNKENSGEKVKTKQVRKRKDSSSINTASAYSSAAYARDKTLPITLSSLQKHGDKAVDSPQMSPTSKLFTLDHSPAKALVDNESMMNGSLRGMVSPPKPLHIKTSLASPKSGAEVPAGSEQIPFVSPSPEIPPNSTLELRNSPIICCLHDNAQDCEAFVANFKSPPRIIGTLRPYIEPLSFIQTPSSHIKSPKTSSGLEETVQPDTKPSFYIQTPSQTNPENDIIELNISDSPIQTRSKTRRLKRRQEKRQYRRSKRLRAQQRSQGLNIESSTDSHEDFEQSKAVAFHERRDLKRNNRRISRNHAPVKQRSLCHMPCPCKKHDENSPTANVNPIKTSWLMNIPVTSDRVYIPTDCRLAQIRFALNSANDLSNERDKTQASTQQKPIPCMNFKHFGSTCCDTKDLNAESACDRLFAKFFTPANDSASTVGMITQQGSDDNVTPKNSEPTKIHDLPESDLKTDSNSKNGLLTLCHAADYNATLKNKTITKSDDIQESSLDTDQKPLPVNGLLTLCQAASYVDNNEDLNVNQICLLLENDPGIKVDPNTDEGEHEHDAVQSKTSKENEKEKDHDVMTQDADLFGENVCGNEVSSANVSDDSAENKPELNDDNEIICSQLDSPNKSRRVDSFGSHTMETKETSYNHSVCVNEKSSRKRKADMIDDDGIEIPRKKKYKCSTDDTTTSMLKTATDNASGNASKNARDHTPDNSSKNSTNNTSENTMKSSTDKTITTVGCSLEKETESETNKQEDLPIIVRIDRGLFDLPIAINDDIENTARKSGKISFMDTEKFVNYDSKSAKKSLNLAHSAKRTMGMCDDEDVNVCDDLEDILQSHKLIMESKSDPNGSILLWKNKDKKNKPSQVGRKTNARVSKNTRSNLNPDRANSSIGLEKEDVTDSRKQDIVGFGQKTNKSCKRPRIDVNLDEEKLCKRPRIDLNFDEDFSNFLPKGEDQTLESNQVGSVSVIKTGEIMNNINTLGNVIEIHGDIECEHYLMGIEEPPELEQMNLPDINTQLDLSSNNLDLNQSYIVSTTCDNSSKTQRFNEPLSYQRTGTVSSTHSVTQRCHDASSYQPGLCGNEMQLFVEMHNMNRNNNVGEPQNIQKSVSNLSDIQNNLMNSAVYTRNSGHILSDDQQQGFQSVDDALRFIENHVIPANSGGSVRIGVHDSKVVEATSQPLIIQYRPPAVSNQISIVSNLPQPQSMYVKPVTKNRSATISNVPILPKPPANKSKYKDTLIRSDAHDTMVVEGPITNQPLSVPSVRPSLPNLRVIVPNRPTSVPNLLAIVPNLTPGVPHLYTIVPNSPATVPNIPATVPNLRATTPNRPATVPNLPATVPNLRVIVPKLPPTLPTGPDISTTQPHPNTLIGANNMTRSPGLPDSIYVEPLIISQQPTVQSFRPSVSNQLPACSKKSKPQPDQNATIGSNNSRACPACEIIDVDKTITFLVQQQEQQTQNLQSQAFYYTQIEQQINSSSSTMPTSMEQLLERQWDQGSAFLMEQGQHFDIASLLTCLHQLRQENQRLEEHINNLSARRDHLLAVNARLALPHVHSPPERAGGGGGQAQQQQHRVNNFMELSGAPSAQQIQLLFQEAAASRAGAPPPPRGSPGQANAPQHNSHSQHPNTSPVTKSAPAGVNGPVSADARPGATSNDPPSRDANPRHDVTQRHDVRAVTSQSGGAMPRLSEEHQRMYMQHHNMMFSQEQQQQMMLHILQQQAAYGAMAAAPPVTSSAGARPPVATSQAPPSATQAPPKPTAVTSADKPKEKT